MSDWINGLERLKALKDAGHLTDREYEAAKARLIDDDQSKHDSYLIHELSDVKNDSSNSVTMHAVASEYDYEESGYQGSTWVRKIVAVITISLIGIGAFFWLSDKSAVYPMNVKAKSPINCRAAPGVDEKSLMVIYDNFSFRVDQEKNGWLLVGDSKCWVKKDLVIVQDTEAKAVPSASSANAAPESRAVSELPGDAPIAAGTPTGRNTCIEAIGQSAARACEVSVLDTLYQGSPPDKRMNSQAFSIATQKQCPGSAKLLMTLYQASTNSMISQMSLGSNANRGQDPGPVLLTRCLGEVAGAMASLPGLDAELSRFR
ncbi:SHOCT domain-containing protein [Blastomonas sp.]|uniref:SHOCT domain-containing protein n=1 Tax=Blastomonas sp. TaxID=1909299 RepID=UPI0017D37C70|nr:SHOCT domain-containing protein [Blastomonas sp.]